MKGRSFETFEVTSGNREAFEYCQRIASLEEMGPALVLLLGPESCGKSHLLWAIAKKVRLSTIPVGLALITPRDFPDKVRELAEDPRPIQGRRAMLLVDNLEGFEAEGRRLEAVIEAFLNHQHPVLIAGNVHPNRLQKLSGPLRARFARSPVIAMEPRPMEEGGPVEAHERYLAMEERIAGLEAERDTLNQKLAIAFASAEDLAAEVVALTEKNAELRDEAEYAIGQQVRVQAALSAAKFELEERAGIGEQLAERQEALTAAECCVADALAKLEQMRTEYAEHGEELLSDINAMADQLSIVRSGPAADQAPLLRALEEAGVEQKCIREALTATRERLKVVEFEWAKSRKVLAIQTAEMDALRYTAAGQVASANVQAGEMERRIDTMEAALAQVESGALELTASLPDDGSVARRLRAALEHMQAQLQALKKARTAKRDEADAGPTIFETDFFEALPEDFQVPARDKSYWKATGLSEDLKNALQGAFSAAPVQRAEDSDGPRA